MTEILEWEWRQVDPADHEALECSELHGVYALGRLWALVALGTVDDADDPGEGETWMYYTAPDSEDAWNGYESIDGFPTLDEAKAFIDDDRDQVLEHIRAGN